jgi:hypothetical protein
MEGSGSRLVNFDRVLCMDNSSVGVVLRGLGPNDVVNSQQLALTVNVIDSSGTVFGAFHEGGQLRISAPTKQVCSFFVCLFVCFCFAWL